LGIACISENTYFRHQSSFLLKTIENVLNDEEGNLMEERKHKPLKLGGDGRKDSVGHSAKYGSYTLMDLDDNKIIFIHVVQVLEHFTKIIIHLNVKEIRLI